MDYWVQDTCSMEYYYWVHDIRAMLLGTGHYSNEVLGTGTRAMVLGT